VTRSPYLVCVLVLALAGCELVKNTGRVCLVPKDVECTCEGSDEAYGCGLLDEFSSAGVSCRGTYPANVSYEIDAHLYEGGMGYAVKEKCKVKVKDDRLRVTASFWHEPEQDAIVEPPAHTTCSVGTLAAGTWILEYGDNQATVEIGDADLIQDMVCVESTKQHQP
jgi:hypothetical protein